MANSILGRNLGRWAEVYFSTPAERREQAVLKLLHELERSERPELATTSQVEWSVAPETPATNEHITAPEGIGRQFEPPGSLAAVDHLQSHMCPVCQYANRPDQLYCGMCGHRLNTPSSSEPVGEQSSPPEVREQRIEKDIETVLPLFGSQLPYAQEPKTVRIMDRTPLGPLHVEDEGRGASAFRLIAVVAVLAAAALVFLYERRGVSPSTPTAASSSPSSSTEPVTLSHAPARDSAETAAPPVLSLSESHKSEERPTRSSAPAVTSPNVPEVPAHSADAAQSAAAARAQSASPKAGVPERGNEEFERARELLAGRTNSPDAGQASAWLWKAVAKNNEPAVLLLADLYARGDGVPRSCDQARILLTAALKRGPAEASQKLQELPKSGCFDR
jgi:hypothetical protein